MTTEAPRAPGAGACPAPEQLAAYVEGALPESERMLVESHLVACADCRDIVGAVAAMPAAPAGSGTLAFKRKARAKWIVVAGGLLATAAAVVLIVRLQRPSPYYVPEMAELVKAVGTSRPVEPRLTGGFAYGGFSALRGDAATAPTLALLAAAAALEQRAKAGDSKSEAALGVAQLLVHDSRALQTLEDAARRDPRDARIRTDLAAAYLDAARRREDAQMLAKALESSDQAIATDPKSPEAVFNRALALQSLGLSEQARQAWDAYLALDHTSQWADEARRNRAALVVPGRSALDQFRERLETVARGGSPSELTRVVLEDTYEAREFIESQLLERWAAAIKGGDLRSAAAALETAGPIAEALLATTRDRFTADVVADAEQSSDQASLAEGILDYGRGRRELDQFHTQRADEFLAQSVKLLHRCGSPLLLAARFQRTLPAYYRREYDDTNAALIQLHAAAVERSYLSLTAQITWRLGLVRLVRASYAGSLSSYREALRVFERTHEIAYIASVENALAEGLLYVGEMDASWASQLRALRGITRTWNPRRRHAILLTAALSCLRDDLPRCALSIQDELVANAVAWGEPAALTSAHLQRAKSLAALERIGDAEAEIAAAKGTLTRITDRTFADQYRTELALTSGEVLVKTRPADAIVALRTADEELTASGAVLRRPQLLLAAGRATRLEGDTLGAEAAFESGIKMFEARRGTIPQEASQISMFDESWQLFEEVTRLEIEQDRPERALAFVERARGRALLKRNLDEPLTPSAIRERLPNGTALLYYAVLSDRLFLWALTSTTITFHQTSITRAQVEDLVKNAHAEVLSASTRGTANERLYDLLIRPIADCVARDIVLAVVADGPLHSVSFATLVDHNTGEPLIATHAVMTAVSGTMLVSGRPYAAGESNVAVVGNPRFNPEEFPGLPRLPEAEREARAVAVAYKRATILVGGAATKEAFRNALRNTTTVHFAGHALSNADYPWLSRLVLAASMEGSTLFAYEIPDLPLARVNLVVLAACSTAAGTISRSEGPLSLARPFITAGVPIVIATLWDVADAPSRALLSDLHRRIAAGAAPVTALRDAQLSMLHASDPALRQPGAWAAFEAIGSIPPKATISLSSEEEQR